MNPKDLPSLLRHRPVEDPGRGPACPDDQAIAAYVDGALDNGSRETIDIHLADCDHCLALVGLLSRELSADVGIAVPDGDLDRARGHTHSRGRRDGWRAPQWATAAVVLVAVAALVRLSQPLGPTDESVNAAVVPTTRTAVPSSSELTVLSPSQGAVVNPGRLTVRWTPVPGSRYYDVRIVTDAGDVVIAQQVTGTEWRPTVQSALQPGAEYFVHVDAFVADDKSVGSEHVAFRFSE
jgi:Putative zinc-finger